MTKGPNEANTAKGWHARLDGGIYADAIMDCIASLPKATDPPC